ncbi:MAG TPA: exonuclease domain-containing protein [Desulfobacterales bacterium]|nr:exonuclease domain-containing protein [Desulfobacterales bacterium]
MIEYGYVCVDVETTGLDRRIDEIVEVTATEYNLSGVMGESLHFLCRPKSGFIPKEASDIHGIMYDMVKNEPNYLEGGIREKIADFIKDRIVTGHNVRNFDIGFLKIQPKEMEDTLEMSRRRFPGRSNKLQTACQRLNIPWDSGGGHRSGFDVSKTILLHLKLKEFELKQAEANADTPIFSAEIVNDAKQINDPTTFGILLNEADQQMVATQAYSYSRINLFKQCPLKWFMQYVKGFKQPDEDYLIVGSVVHKICDKSGEWCFRELFANKFVIFAKKSGMSIEEKTILMLKSYYNKEEVTFHDFGKYLFENPEKLKSYFNSEGLYKFILNMDKHVRGEQYETPSIPTPEDYELIIQTSINQFRVTDPETVLDIRRLAAKFYRNANFAQLPGDIVLTEKRMVFDKNWIMLSDFYANNAFFRAIIDAIYYFGRTIVIKDYKTSRKMMKECELPEDMQLLTYVLMIYKFIPRNSYDKIIIEIEYVRFGKKIKLELNGEEIDGHADKAMKWVMDSIQEIEKEMLKTSAAFSPVRNEYCHTCHIGGDGRCPLFNKSLINKIDDPFNFIIDNISDCEHAWKRVEVNKSENSRLIKLCKAFVEQCESSVKIDKNAVLDFYTLKKINYNPMKAVHLLLKKGLPIEEILSFMSFPTSQMEKLLEYKEIKLTDEEVSGISEESTETKFDAFTDDQAKSKGFINS